MFKLNKKTSFTWPVKAKVIADNGKYSTVSFKAEFKRMSQTEIDDLLTKIRSDDQDMTDRSLCDEVIVSLADIFDEDGNELPYDASLKKQVLDEPGMANVISRTFFEALAGAREKN